MAEELKELNQYYGTTKYHQIDFMGKIVGTDGIAYVMSKGYSWAITDALVILNTKLKGQEFVVIELKLDGNQAKMIYSDGDGHELYKQKYKWTDAKTELKMYYTDKVLMLASEY